MLHTRMTTLDFILSELFPLDGFRCNFVSATMPSILNAVRNIFMRLYHGDEPSRILVVQNRILFVISGFYLCKRVFVGRGKYPENHM